MPKGGTMKSDQFDWTPDRIQYLRASWGKVPSSRMAERLCCTRSAVIGKAHRLGLAHLGNPVGKAAFKPAPSPRQPYQRRDETGALKVTGHQGRADENNPGGIRARQQSRIAAPTRSFPTLKQGAHPAALAGSAELVARKRAEPVTRTPGGDSLGALVPAASEPKPAGARRHGVRFADLRADGCKWAVTGHAVAVADHRFCGAERDGHAAYCAEHVKKATGKPATATGNLAAIDNWSPNARHVLAAQKVAG